MLDKLNWLFTSLTHSSTIVNSISTSVRCPKIRLAGRAILQKCAMSPHIIDVSAFHKIAHNCLGPNICWDPRFGGGLLTEEVNATAGTKTCHGHWVNPTVLHISWSPMHDYVGESVFKILGHNGDVLPTCTWYAAVMPVGSSLGTDKVQAATLYCFVSSKARPG